MLKEKNLKGPGLSKIELKINLQAESLSDIVFEIKVGAVAGTV